jgi:hypothetical protein
MTFRLNVRRVFAVDGAGCAAAAGALIVSDRLADAVGISSRKRWAVAAALGATSAILLSETMSPGPSNGELKRAALINCGWTVTCLFGLRGRPSYLGAALLVGTAAFDAVAGIAQWHLQSDPV